MYEVVSYGIIVLGTIIFILAIFWEYCDINRLENRPPLEDLPEDEQEDELLFYGCFNYENRVAWRCIYIASFISTLLIIFLLMAFRIRPSLDLTLCNPVERPGFGIVVLTFLAILIIAYIVDHFKEYHLYRLMCYKIKPGTEAI